MKGNSGFDYDSARVLSEGILASRAAYVTSITVPCLLILTTLLCPTPMPTSECEDKPLIDAKLDLVVQLLSTTIIFICYAVLYPDADAPKATLPTAKAVLAMFAVAAAYVAYRVVTSEWSSTTECMVRTLIPTTAMMMFIWNFCWTWRLDGVAVWQRFRISYAVYICCRLCLASLLRCLEPQPQRYPPGSLSFPGACALNIYNLTLVLILSTKNRQFLGSIIRVTTVTLTLDHLPSHSLRKPQQGSSNHSSSTLDASEEHRSAVNNSEFDAQSDLRRSTTLTTQEDVISAMLESHFIYDTASRSADGD